MYYLFLFLLMVKSNKKGKEIESINSEHVIESLDRMASEGFTEVTFE